PIGVFMNHGDARKSHRVANAFKYISGMTVAPVNRSTKGYCMSGVLLRSSGTAVLPEWDGPQSNTAGRMTLALRSTHTATEIAAPVASSFGPIGGQRRDVDEARLRRPVPAYDACDESIELRACTHKSPSHVRFRANRTLSRHHCNDRG